MDSLAVALRNSAEAARLAKEATALLEERDRLKQTIVNLSKMHEQLAEVELKIDAITTELALLIKAAQSAMV
jgi:hypothetical protein